MFKFYQSVRQLLLTASISIISFSVLGQSGSGEIYGTVSDKGGPLPGAKVTVYQGGIIKFQKPTNMKGEYSIKPVPSGEYEVEASFTGIGKKRIKINLAIDAQSKNDFVLGSSEGPAGDTLKGAIVTAEKLLSTDGGPGNDRIGGDKINRQASRKTSEFANLAAGVLSTKAGDNSSISIGGARNENTTFIIDGVIVRGSRNVNLPIGSISSLEVMGTGVPAKYGDATGGVIAITTRGISAETRGSFYLERSIEGFGHNQVSLNLSGPLYKKYDSAIMNKRPVAGYFLAGDYINDKDGNPNYYKNAQVRQEVIDDLEQNPLTRNAAGNSVFQPRTDFLTNDEITYIKYRPNARSRSGQLVSKLDFMPSLYTNITIGLQMNYANFANWSRANSLVNYRNNEERNNYSGRTYLRFSQRLKDDPNDTTKKLSNVYFSGQIAYQKDYLGIQNLEHKKNFFNYGHIGRFEEDLQPVYNPLYKDTATGLIGYGLVGYSSENLDYSRGNSNDILSNYTDYVYDNIEINSLQDVQAYGGLRNGDYAKNIYGLYFNVGRPVARYRTSEADQISLNLESGFTWKPGKGRTVHNMEVGFYYEQRNDRDYNLFNAYGLWNLMRLSANRHIRNLDLSNPIFIKNGQEYTYDDWKNSGIPFVSLDTIFYNRKYVAEDQSEFDKNVRRKLGLAVDGTDYIQVDALDPSFFDLSMFSPDDLFNEGQTYLVYSGYDYLGNRLKGRTSFNDFFLEKNGDVYTRNIGAFRPVYLAGYIMDKFRYQDISLNLGLRIDRYDANTKVMRDPYSLYGVRTVGELQSGSYNTYGDIGIPGNIGEDYVVYVGENSSKPQIAGYRNGDTWYDPFGREVEDPKVLKDNYTGSSNNLQPYLENADDDIKNATEEMLNRTFEDYKPQITASPRFQFSFPVNDISMVYANYDIMVQRPKGTNTTSIGNINFFNPYDYYFFEQNQQSYLPNANLRPERMIVYEMGFQQVLDKKSRMVFTLSAFYNERKDQISVRPYLYAFPKQYNAFGNRDFSTSKGLKLKYSSRIGKTADISVNYTFLTSEGTASNTTGNLNLVRNGQGSLRLVNPLSTDVRHNVKANLYNMFVIKDPSSFLRKAVNGIGLNLMANVRSGAPFTRYARPQPYGGTQNGDPILGTLNGSRLPWNFNLDAKIDKNIYLRRAKEGVDGMPEKKPIVFNAFFFVQNIFNTRNVLNVYGYTGSPDDDGYLDSDFGQQAISVYPAIQRQSYIDMYNIILYNQPTFFNTPRRMTIGLSYNF